jgi:Cu(I)/Ag(I) efflux system membrane protein CusA/SilA
LIERIISFSIRRRRLVLFLAGVFIIVGITATLQTPVDAIPDLSENQVIVHAAWPGQRPEEVERQLTAPLSAGLRSTPGVRVVRTTSEFGTSMLDVIFESSVAREEARSRVSARLAELTPRLPRDASPAMAPDATAVGQVFWYTVEGEGHDLGELRSLQDSYVRPLLEAVPGVAEAASAGGAPREVEVEVLPTRLATHEVSLSQVAEAVRRASTAVPGGVLQDGSTEFVLSGRAVLESPEALEQAVVAEKDGVPVLLRHVARVQYGTGPRRCILEKDGREAVGGVVVLRYGANPKEVIGRVRQAIADLSPGLPAGVRIVPFHDRSRLVDRAIHTATTTLLQEMVVACLAIVLVMGHAGGAAVVCLGMPLAVLFSLTLMRLLGIPSNIMSLAGIAISVGVLVDQSIVLTDNAMHHLRRKFGDAPVTGDIGPLIDAPAREVGRPLFFAVLIMVLSFLPVFALQGMEGKMYLPLALTKTFALVGALLLTITVLPAALPYVLRGRIRDESENWFVRTFIAVYRPVLAWLLPRPAVALWILAMLLLGASGFLGSRALTAVFAVAAAVVAAFFGRPTTRWLGVAVTAGTAFLAAHAPPLGREFMPPLDEGDIIDMPVTIPRVSMAQVADDLKARDALLRTFPEVAMVVGKAGRAETATDPAPLEMVETLVSLLPREQWPRRLLDDRTFRDLGRAVHEEAGAAGLLKAREQDPPSVSTLLAEAAENARWRFDVEMRDLAGSLRRNASASEVSVPGVEAIDQVLATEAPAAAARAVVGAWLAKALSAALLPREPDERLLGALRDRIASHLGPRPLLHRATHGTLVREMDALLQVPGWANIWTQPIVNRIDMMATGIRTSVGVKVFGPDPATLQDVAQRVAEVVRRVPGATDVVADQGQGRAYFEVVPDRDQAAAYGVAVADVAEAAVEAAAGRIVAAMRTGREEVPVRVRLARDDRDDPASLRRLPVATLVNAEAAVPPGPTSPARHPAHGALPPTPSATTAGIHGHGGLVPLSAVAAVHLVEGPSMIRGEDGFPCAYVQLGFRGRDPLGFVEDAKEAVQREVRLPEGVRFQWGGQFEHQQSARRTLMFLLPVALLAVAFVLYVTYRDARDVLLVMATVPGALAGGVLLQALWGTNFSVAVWIGYVASLGMAIQSGMIMLVYLREAITRRGGLDAIRTPEELRDAVLEGAVQRQRPKLLTELTTVLSLVPMLWATGTGAEVTSVMALPVLGGILVADEVVDVLLPVAFFWWMKSRTENA